MKPNRVPGITVLLGLLFAITFIDNRPTFAETGVSAGSTSVRIADNNYEAAIRQQIGALSGFLTAAKAAPLAALWLPDGIYMGSDGSVTRGRAALEKRFSSVFKETGKQVYELTPETISLLSNGVAQSQGTVKHKDALTSEPETRYLMTFVKQEGVWLISAAVETAYLSREGDIAGHESLDDLGWLIGEWKAERNGGTVHMKAEWMEDNNFIRCQYRTAKAGEPEQEDLQIIGFDSVKGHPVSWFFQSGGATAHGTWFHNDSKWTVKSTALLHNGMSATATNIIDPADPNSFVWQSCNRNLDGIAIGDSQPLKVERINQ